jgi:hypothetical protein
MLCAALARLRGGESILGQAEAAMRCVNCRNEVFCISTHSGEPIFYCVECGVPHFPESAEVRTKLVAGPPHSDLERVDG